MFHINFILYKFSDLSLYCVGTKEAIHLLNQYYTLHKDTLIKERFIQRIIFSKIYAFAESKSLKSLFKCQSINKQLDQAGLLMDMDQFDEAMFIAEPHKCIKALGATDYYNSEVTISEYWRTRFPSLPEKVIVPSPDEPI